MLVYIFWHKNASQLTLAGIVNETSIPAYYINTDAN